jgi:hypothetical protein
VRPRPFGTYSFHAISLAGCHRGATFRSSPGHVWYRLFGDSTNPAAPRSSPEGAAAGESSQMARWHEGAACAGTVTALGNQAELAGPRDGLGPVGRAELAQDVADVLFGRVEADYEFPGDALVRRARG